MTELAAQTLAAGSEASPYFAWDRQLGSDELRGILANRDDPERIDLLALLLREARPDHVWRFVTPEDVAAEWAELAPKLGRRRAFWEWLLASWRSLGYLS